MEHRRFLAHAQAHRPFSGTDLFTRIGGQATVDALVDGLYDRIETDRGLRALFGRDLDHEREALKRFFTEWFGGEATYTERAFLPLEHRHDLLPITPAVAVRWLAHFHASLEVAVSDATTRSAIYATVNALATALVNESEPTSPLRARPHGSCLRYAPAIESLALARRGDVEGLRMSLQHAPASLASAAHAALLMQIATQGGHTRVVELLLDRGVDVNKPSAMQPLIFITPLCAARLRRRTEIEVVLVQHGAREDIFTHAFLGDVERLRDDLLHEPAWAQTDDPAVDALEITPVHHAVAGERVEALRILLSHASQRGEVLRGGARALREAAAREKVAMVQMLIELGADATSIGAGRWVLHPELAPMLSRAGARVDRSGGWIGLACTGNQGRKDDPDYVAALLRHGAGVNDKRLVGQGADGGRATALHYAARAGFVRTIAVLLQHGADPTARDDNGLAPLDWLERSTKSVDRGAVRRLLQAR